MNLLRQKKGPFHPKPTFGYVRFRPIADISRQRHASAMTSSAGPPYPCPCCGNRTVGELAGYEICPVCFWEDDGQGDHDADVVRGGPNRDLSLTVARENYKRISAADPRDLAHVRPPTEEEAEGTNVRFPPIADIPDGYASVRPKAGRRA
jgi:hypothetical protein